MIPFSSLIENMVRGGSYGDNDVQIFGYENINANDPFIDKFLWGQMIHYPHHHQHAAENVAKCNNNANIFNETMQLFPYSVGPNFFVDRVLANEEALKWSNSTLTLKEMHVLDENTKGVRQRTKKESSVHLIKGQWTNEEDRLNI